MLKNMQRGGLAILAAIVIAGFTGCADDFLSGIEGESQSLTYTEILATGIKPAISPDYKFPNAYQFYNGCFAFAVNNVLKYKYDTTIDLLEAEKKIEKPRQVLWDAKYIKAFLKEYNISIYYSQDAQTFYRLLAAGEPVVMQYPIKLESGIYIGHIVAAYSFDDEGVWVADTLSGKRIRLSFGEVFTSDGMHTRYGFAVVELKNN